MEWQRVSSGSMYLKLKIIFPNILFKIIAKKNILECERFSTEKLKAGKINQYVSMPDLHNKNKWQYHSTNNIIKKGI